jgi:hypothetical protein
MNVVVCTAHDEKYDELAAITFPSVRKYVDRHGYVLAYNPRIDPVDADACKAKMFLSIYAQGQYGPDDVFVWVDSDAVIMQSDISVETLLERSTFSKDDHYLIGCDFNGVNSGVWFARFSPQAAHYVQVYSQVAVAMGWG